MSDVKDFYLFFKDQLNFDSFKEIQTSIFDTYDFITGNLLLIFYYYFVSKAKNISKSTDEKTLF